MNKLGVLKVARRTYVRIVVMDVNMETPLVVIPGLDVPLVLDAGQSIEFIVSDAVERCPICGGTTKGGHERDGSGHCWGHDDEGP